jgi:hypothetical protein
MKEERTGKCLPLVEQELLTLLEHMSSPPDFSGVRVTRSLVLCSCFRSLFVLLSIFFWPLCCFARVVILLTRGKHLNDRIISVEEKFGPI